MLVARKQVQKVVYVGLYFYEIVKEAKQQRQKAGQCLAGRGSKGRRTWG